MRIRLNLATLPIEVHRRFLAGAGLAGVVALVALMWLGLHVQGVRARDAKFRADMGQLQSEMRKLANEQAGMEIFFGLPENAKLSGRSQFLNSLIEERSFNWTKMFMDLEKLLPEGVHVITIAPKLQNGRLEVRLVVGASSSEHGTKFVRNLESSQNFKNIRVMHEASPARPEGTDRSQLDLSASYF